MIPPDLRERHPEAVVQHERDAFARGEAVEHDQQRPPDRLGEHHLALGLTVEVVVGRFRDDGPERLFRSRLSRAQRVERQARDDRGQPPGKVVHLGGAGALQP